jgi:hypothetical protein
MPKLSRISDYETTPEKIELGNYCLMILFYQEIRILRVFPVTIQKHLRMV